MKHSTRKGRLCDHRYYLLSCEEIDGLWEEVEGRCQICSIPAAETGHGTLFIDHDAPLGRWAVRGLLCNRCNARLPALTGPAVEAYLASPWWMRAGRSPEDPPRRRPCLPKFVRKAWESGAEIPEWWPDHWQRR